MPSMDALAHTVYCLCNNLEYGDPNLTELEQYEARQNDLLKEECIIKEIIFKTAVAFINEEEYKQYLRSIERSLSLSSKMLESTLANKEADKDAPRVLLQEEAFAVIERLTTFFYDLFPEVLEMDINPDPDARFQLGISVPQIATFANAFSKGITKDDDEKAIVGFIIRHFKSKYTRWISPKSFLNHFRNPEPAAIKKVIAKLKEIIEYLESL